MFLYCINEYVLASLKFKVEDGGPQSDALSTKWSLEQKTLRTTALGHGDYLSHTQ